MKDRHLRLVISHCENYQKQDVLKEFIEKIKEKVREKIDCIFVSKNEKIYMIKDALIQIYRDYELTTGVIDIPYFVRAEKRISKIIKDRKINYYYLRLKKFNNKLY